MRNRLGHKMVLGWLAAGLFLLAGNAQAVSLGKIEVASHLGEPFYAEIPLSLDGDEAISRVFVEIAAPTDYRILEVYRDAVLNSIRADVENDSRGARIELSSRNALDAPFFNLVLKMRYNRATHFKKYPIFLDIPKSIKPEIKRAPLPSVHALQSPSGVDTRMPEPVAAAPVAAPAKTTPSLAAGAFTPYDGWARIGRYGPMVYGDTVSTVAERLRVNDRYSRQQVMMALFEKNRAKFDQDNINLIKAGTYLDVPRAAEVERITPSQARSLIAEHEKRWKDLKRQPRYAAVAEAQRTRYSKRVRVGKQADGIARTPEPALQKGAETTTPSGDTGAVAQNGAAGKTGSADATAEVAAELAALKLQNEALQARLTKNEKQLEALKNKPADAAAAEARNKKLELQLARLQSELDAAREKLAQKQEGGTSWLTWLFGVLALALLGVVGVLMRREPAHPADASSGQQFDTPESVAAAAGTEAAATAPEEDNIPEIEVEEADIEALTDESSFETGTEETAQMTVEEQQAFTDSIPDLTDEDTGSMPAFTEEVEEEPDPNVDYLSEADVYMRYGMEDEALQQVDMALRLKPDNAEAHIKKAELLQAKGNSEAFGETIADATQTLAGSDLERFNEAIGELQSAQAGGSESAVSLEDTLPPTNVSGLIGEEVASEESGLEAEATVSEIEDLGFGDAELDTSSTSEEGVDTIIDQAGVSDTAELDAAMSDLDGLDLGIPEETDAEEAPVEEAPAEESVASIDTDDSSGGLDFDLSDVEMPDLGEAASESEDSQIETADLEKTVAMDWSKDTSVDSDEFDISGESGVEDTAFESVAEEPELTTEATAEAGPEQAGEEISFVEDAVDVEEESAEPEAQESAPAAEVETTASLELGDGDLDDGFDIADAEVEPADDFTSTIRTSLDEVGGEANDFTATGEHDLQLDADASDNLDESMLEAVTDEAKPEADQEVTIDGISLELDDDIDATQKLDSLLSEFTDEDDDKKD